MSDGIDAATRQRLTDWLAARLRQHTAGAARNLALTEAEPFSKGQSNQMIQLACRWDQGGAAHTAEYVVRCEPRGRQLFLKPDALREAQVLRGLEASGQVTVPHVWWAEADESVLGVPFFVMSRVQGLVPLGRPSMHLTGLLTTLTTEQRAQLWQSAMDTLVAVHEVDWRRTHAFLAPEGMDGGHLRAYIDRCAAWYTWAAAGRSFPITDAALAYLRQHAGDFDHDEVGLVWNDARVGNMMFDDRQRVAAALDWEGALIGPAGIDVGYWLMMDEFHAEAIGVPRLPGWPDAPTTLATYQRLSGRTVANVDYFVVLAAFFIATTLIRQADLGVQQGRFAPDTTMGTANSTTQIIARRLGLSVPELSPDFARHRGLALPANG